MLELECRVGVVVNKYDVIIIGSGPAGIFTALELLKEKNIQNTEFSHCKIVENTFYVEDIYTKFNMIFYYEDGTEIEVQVGILNKQASKTFVLTIFA